MQGTWPSHRQAASLQLAQPPGLTLESRAAIVTVDLVSGEKVKGEITVYALPWVPTRGWREQSRLSSLPHCSLPACHTETKQLSPCTSFKR